MGARRLQWREKRQEVTGFVHINPVRDRLNRTAAPLQTVRDVVVFEVRLRPLLILDTIRWIMLLVQRAQNPRRLVWFNANTMLLQGQYISIGNVQISRRYRR